MADRQGIALSGNSARFVDKPVSVTTRHLTMSSFFFLHCKRKGMSKGSRQRKMGRRRRCKKTERETEVGRSIVAEIFIGYWFDKFAGRWEKRFPILNIWEGKVVGNIGAQVVRVRAQFTRRSCSYVSLLYYLIASLNFTVGVYWSGSAVLGGRVGMWGGHSHTRLSATRDSRLCVSARYI